MQAVPLTKDGRYAIHMLALTTGGIDQLGAPLHIMNGPEILHSFGASIEGASLNELSVGRNLAADGLGHVFSGRLGDGGRLSGPS